jgi:DNA primase
VLKIERAVRALRPLTSANGFEIINHTRAMEFVEQLKASVDIVNVVGEYVRLRKTGVRHVGLCPFHTEKTPSFSVHGVHQFYKCFGCGAGGDVLRFVMEIERVSFYEALKMLAERYGIPMPRRAEYSDPETRLRAALYRMHEIAQDAYRAHLASTAGAEVRSYLERRGVDTPVAEQFALGYADRSGRMLTRMLEKEFTPEELEAGGLVLKRPDGTFFDRFRNRLMFPIRNESGKVIAYGGRALEKGDEPKYLNSSETAIYKKSYTLYNLDRARDAIRKAERVVLVEGYMDVIGVSAAGIGEVVASCGTSLTSHQVRALKRHSGRVVVNFDPDAPGANAAERSINLLLDESMQVRVLQLDGGLDPDEYCKQRGADAYRQSLDSAKTYFYWLADRARLKFDMKTAEGRVAAFQFLVPAVHRLSDKLERVAVANDVASYLGVDSGLVLENFRKIAGDRRDRQIQPPPSQPVRAVERILLNLLLTNAEARNRIVPELRAMQVTDEFATRGIFQALITLAEPGSSFGFAELHARLSESDQELLAAATLLDETEEAALSLEQGEACLRKLQSGQWQAHRARLRAMVREAERAGNMDEAIRLSEELNRLVKRVSSEIQT